VLVSAVFWTWLWGPIGLVLATPLTVCLVVIGKYVPQLQFLDILLGDQPVLEPPQKVYQRLLAMDADEVSDQVDELLKTMSLEDVYDQVLIPALAMAEEDRHRERLDEQRHKFIRQSMRDLIEELGDRTRAEEARATAARTVEAAQGKPEAPKPTPAPAPSATSGNGKPHAEPAAPPHRGRIPKDCVVNVVCLPSHDEADEIVAMMLAQLLELRGYRAHHTSVDALASEMVELTEKKEADIACISALPPAAVAHARYLCKRLRAKFDDLEIVVGLWTFKGDAKRAADRIACDKNVTLSSTLGQAIEKIHQMAQPLLVARESSGTSE
jgi:cell division septation protein DedD